jgi:nucleoside phosphorylase
MNLLVAREPDAARVCAAALSAAGDESGRALGEQVIAEVGLASGALFERADVCPPSIVATKDVIAVDVLVLSVKPVELDACLRAFGLAFPATPTPLIGGGEAWLAEYRGTKYAIACVGTDGNVESAIKLLQLFQGLAFRLPVLVGMAAGVRGEVNLGDVVIAEQVWAADFEILRREGSVPRPKTYSPASRVWSKIGSLESVYPEWGKSVKEAILSVSVMSGHRWPLPDRYETLTRLPKVKTGVVFAGSRLIEDNSLVRRRGHEQGRLLAGEMEGAGFAASVQELGWVDWLVIRGVADFGAERRAKNWQFASTYAAAAVLRDGVEHGRITLPSQRLT